VPFLFLCFFIELPFQKMETLCPFFGSLILTFRPFPLNIFSPSVGDNFFHLGRSDFDRSSLERLLWVAAKRPTVIRVFPF